MQTTLQAHNNIHSYSVVIHSPYNIIITFDSITYSFKPINLCTIQYFIEMFYHEQSLAEN